MVTEAAEGQVQTDDAASEGELQASEPGLDLDTLFKERGQDILTHPEVQRLIQSESDKKAADLATKRTDIIDREADRKAQVIVRGREERIRQESEASARQHAEATQVVSWWDNLPADEKVERTSRQPQLPEQVATARRALQQVAQPNMGLVEKRIHELTVDAVLDKNTELRYMPTDRREKILTESKDVGELMNGLYGYIYEERTAPEIAELKRQNQELQDRVKELELGEAGSPTGVPSRAGADTFEALENKFATEGLSPAEQVQYRKLRRVRGLD